MKSSHKKELWCFAYQYVICIFCQTENGFHGNVTYFLWHVSIPSYKNIKIWVMRVYIINGRVTINMLDDRSHRVYFMVYLANTGVILYWNPDKPFFFTKLIMFGLINIILVSPYNRSILQVLYYFNNILKVFFTIRTSST